MARARASLHRVARENGHVDNACVTAADPLVAPYHSLLLKRTPKGEPREPRAWRMDDCGIEFSPRDRWAAATRRAASYWLAGSTLKLFRVADAPA